MADVLTHIDTLDVEVAPQEELDVTVGSPMEHSRVLSITKNGKHVVSEYDLANVDVHTKTSGMTALSFRGNTDTYINASELDVSHATAIDMFCNCKNVETIDITGWKENLFSNLSFNYDSKLKRIIGHEDIDTSKWTACASFYFCDAIEWLDCSKWDYTNVKTISQNSFMMSGIKTFIGDHTLKEVEEGNIVAFKGWGANYYRLQISSWYVRDLRFSSLLAVLNGMADRTGMEQAGSFEIGNKNRLFGRLKNDDDTIPNATTLAERQAIVRAICAEKNYNLVLA